MRHRIIIQEIDKPHRNYLQDEVKWICESLGLTSGRDTEDMSFKIMYDLLNQFQSNDIVPSEEVARSLSVDTPRVNHHLRNLMDTGIIIKKVFPDYKEPYPCPKTQTSKQLPQVT